MSGAARGASGKRRSSKSCNKETTALTTEIFKYIKDRYNGEAERPWVRAPGYIVFRHQDNNRIYGVATTVPLTKLGIREESLVDVLTVKVGNPLLRELLLSQKGIFPGLGFGERNWITILLDGTVAWEDIISCIDRSFFLTASHKTRKAQTSSAG